MGLNKAFVEVDGTPVIEWGLKVLQGLFEEVIIVATQPELYTHLGFTVHTDLLLGNDSMGGVHAALSYASSEICFLCACDMLFLNPRLINYLVDLAPGADAVVPKSPARPAGHGILSRKPLNDGLNGRYCNCVNCKSIRWGWAGLWVGVSLVN